MHRVGEVGASLSKVPESAEHIGDHDMEGKSQTLIGVMALLVLLLLRLLPLKVLIRRLYVRPWLQHRTLALSATRRLVSIELACLP
ncbi:hypothetical protein HAX54_021069 [Datura stramonium]|uniref:Uncharacterized protein n=1 Tax=Datura stramonium TaxID=4076 RepID=A0ABS8UTL9_DATST|nr:hypothetical protein [Datura stramonium]